LRTGDNLLATRDSFDETEHLPFSSDKCRTVHSSERNRGVSFVQKKKQRTCVFDREKHSTAFVLLREKQSICFFQREAEHIFCPIALLVENVL
jgi:hypothetical protein